MKQELSDPLRGKAHTVSFQLQLSNLELKDQTLVSDLNLFLV